MKLHRAQIAKKCHDLCQDNQSKDVIKHTYKTCMVSAFLPHLS